IAPGEGVIAMIIEDGGTVETAAKTIPILLQTLDLAIYPEGGDLIAGLPNRVYVVGQTPARKPADMAGVVVNAAGRKVATFHTEHEGRGRFSFVPVKGEAYSLRITEPAGIKTVFASGGESIWCRHFIDVRYHTQVKGCRRPGRRYIRWLVSHRVKPARKRTRIQTGHAAGDSTNGFHTRRSEVSGWRDRSYGLRRPHVADGRAIDLSS